MTCTCREKIIVNCMPCHLVNEQYKVCLLESRNFFVLQFSDFNFRVELNFSSVLHKLR